jgi:hypothetical protein
MWDRGYLRGMERAAHHLANSVDRERAKGGTDGE